MTLTTHAETEVVEVTPTPEPSPHPPRSRERVRTVAARFALALAMLAAVVLFFEVPVQQTWYHSRQRELQTDFKTPHAGLASGQAAALLQLPKYGVNVVVVQGDGPGQLRDGPGHRPGTPLPGQRGNSIILGHRKAWGGPFGALAQMHKGDFIVTQIRGKVTNPLPVVYTVVSIHHVPASDTRLSGRSKDYRLTLVTGDGSLLSSDRLVVTAVSGKALNPAAHGPAITLPGESPILNVTLGLAAAAFVLAGVAAGYLRRRYRLLAVLAVVVPLVLAGAFALLIDLDLLLPPCADGPAGGRGAGSSPSPEIGGFRAVGGRFESRSDASMNGAPTLPEQAQASIEDRPDGASTARGAESGTPHDRLEGSSVGAIRKILAVLGVGAASAILMSAPAFAGSISSPTGSPYVYTSLNPVSVTVTGFSPGQSVYIEQCDGVSPSAPGWSPTTDCDNGTSPAAGIADGSGDYTFSASDTNHAFTPFEGESPSGLFNCLYPGEGSLTGSDGLPDYTNCQIRVSSNNGASTADQAFLTIQLPQPSAQTPEVPYAVVLPLGALAIGGAFLLIRKRRTARATV